MKKVFILNDKEAYGLGVATNFRNAATKLGIKTVGFTAWDGKASSYEALAVKIKASGAQGVFLGGLICENGGKVIKDIRAGVPASVKIMLPDGFTPASATIKEAGSAAQGATISVAGLPNSALKGAGKAFVTDFTKAVGVPDPYSVYAAQATEVMVQAIAQSNGSRADVTKQLFKVNLKNSHPRERVLQLERRRDLEPGHDLQGQGQLRPDPQGDRAAQVARQGGVSPGPRRRGSEGRAKALPGPFPAPDDLAIAGHVF